MLLIAKCNSLIMTLNKCLLKKNKKLYRVLGGGSILFVLTAKASSLEASAFFLDFPLDCVLFAYFPFLPKCITFATFSHAPYHFISFLFSLYCWYRRVLLAYYLDIWWKSILLVIFLTTKTGQAKWNLLHYVII